MKAVTHFSMWGNCIAVRIPSHIAKEAGIVEGRPVELSVVNGALMVSPLDPAPVYTLADLVSGITDENRHGEIGTGSAKGNESF